MVFVTVKHDFKWKRNEKFVCRRQVHHWSLSPWKHNIVTVLTTIWIQDYIIWRAFHAICTLEVVARLPAVGGGDSHTLIHTRGWALETKEEKGFDVMEAVEQAENFHHLSVTLHFFITLKNLKYNDCTNTKANIILKIQTHSKACLQNCQMYLCF